MNASSESGLWATVMTSRSVTRRILWPRDAEGGRFRLREEAARGPIHLTSPPPIVENGDQGNGSRIRLDPAKSFLKRNRRMSCHSPGDEKERTTTQSFGSDRLKAIRPYTRAAK